MKTSTKLILTTAILALILVAPLVRADDNGISAHDDNGNVVLQTQNLTAIFNGENPSIMFSFTNNATERYYVKFSKLLEFNSTNGTLGFQHNETVQMADLESARWTHSGFYNITDGVAVNFTTNQLMIEPVSQGSGFHGDLPGDSSTSHLYNVTVTLVAKLFQTNTVHTYTVGNTTFSIQGGVEIKIDIFISNWPFISMNDRLALRVDLHSSVNNFHLGEHEDNQTENSTETHSAPTLHEDTSNNNETEIHGNQTDSQNGPEHDVNETGHEPSVQLLTSNGLVGGFFRFVNTAMTDGTPTPVVASYRVSPDEQDALQNELMLYLSYHSFSHTLEHDPSFGVNPSAYSTNAAAPSLLPFSIALLSGTVASVALVSKRKRISQ